MPFAGDFLAAYRATYDYFLRTNPEGVKNPAAVAVCPNNATPLKLKRLFLSLGDMLAMARSRLLEDKALSAAVDALGGPLFPNPQGDRQVWNDLQYARARLDFYQATVKELAGEPDLQGCGPAGTISAKRLARRVIEPLFSGWYPNELEPFKDQPPPFSAQTERALSDLHNFYMLGEKSGVVAEEIAQNFHELADDIEDRFGDVMEKLPDADELPGVLFGVAGLLGIGWLLTR